MRVLREFIILDVFLQVLTGGLHIIARLCINFDCFALILTSAVVDPLFLREWCVWLLRRQVVILLALFIICEQIRATPSPGGTLHGLYTRIGCIRRVWTDNCRSILANLAGGLILTDCASRATILVGSDFRVGSVGKFAPADYV